MTHTRDHRMWDRILERLFECAFIEWCDATVFPEAVNRMVSTIGEEVK